MDFGKEFVWHFPRISAIFTSSKRIQITVTYEFDRSYSSSSWAGLVKTAKLSDRIIAASQDKKERISEKKDCVQLKLVIAYKWVGRKIFGSMTDSWQSNEMKTPILTSCWSRRAQEHEFWG